MTDRVLNSSNTDEEEFVYDRIMGKRTVNGQVEYQVHWEDVWYNFGKNEESEVLSLTDRNKFLRRGLPVNILKSAAGIARILESRNGNKKGTTDFKVEYKPSWLKVQNFTDWKLIDEFEENQSADRPDVNINISYDEDSDELPADYLNSSNTSSIMAESPMQRRSERFLTKRRKIEKPNQMARTVSSDDSDADEDVFEYDKILGKRRVNGRVEYQVWWKNVWYSFRKNEESRALSLKDRNTFLRTRRPLVVQSSAAGIGKILKFRNGQNGVTTEFEVEFKPSWLELHQFKDRKLIDEFEQNQRINLPEENSGTDLPDAEKSDVEQSNQSSRAASEESIIASDSEIVIDDTDTDGTQENNHPASSSAEERENTVQLTLRSPLGQRREASRESGSQNVATRSRGRLRKRCSPSKEPSAPSSQSSFHVQTRSRGRPRKQPPIRPATDDSEERSPGFQGSTPPSTDSEDSNSFPVQSIRQEYLTPLSRRQPLQNTRNLRKLLPIREPSLPLSSSDDPDALPSTSDARSRMVGRPPNLPQVRPAFSPEEPNSAQRPQPAKKLVKKRAKIRRRFTKTLRSGSEDSSELSEADSYVPGDEETSQSQRQNENPPKSSQKSQTFDKRRRSSGAKESNVRPKRPRMPPERYVDVPKPAPASTSSQNMKSRGRPRKTLSSKARSSSSSAESSTSPQPRRKSPKASVRIGSGRTLKEVLTKAWSPYSSEESERPVPSVKPRRRGRLQKSSLRIARLSSPSTSVARSRMVGRPPNLPEVRPTFSPEEPNSAQRPQPAKKLVKKRAKIRRRFTKTLRSVLSEADSYVPRDEEASQLQRQNENPPKSSQKCGRTLKEFLTKARSLSSSEESERPVPSVKPRRRGWLQKSSLRIAQLWSPENSANSFQNASPSESNPKPRGHGRPRKSPPTKARSPSSSEQSNDSSESPEQSAPSSKRRGRGKPPKEPSTKARSPANSEPSDNSPQTPKSPSPQPRGQKSVKPSARRAHFSSQESNTSFPKSPSPPKKRKKGQSFFHRPSSEDSDAVPKMKGQPPSRRSARKPVMRKSLADYLNGC